MSTQKNIYLKLAASPDHFREDGDGLLFACLQAVAINKSFNVEDYMNWQGQVFRNPAMALGLHKLGPRESTISRDMFMGLLCYCLHFKRLDILQIVAEYGWKNWWKMGTDNQKLNNRVWFTPGLIVLLYAIIAHLRGRPGLAEFLVNIWQPLGTTPGYPSHLTMLHIYLNMRIRGKVAPWEQSVLQKILRHSPRNALALALAGWKEESRAELQAAWPTDRLPTYEDWTEMWRTQRVDNDSGFTGRPGDARKHSGGDLLFVEHVLAL